MQKTLCAIILGKGYTTYSSALNELKLTELKVRRENITYKFADKSSSHPKHKNWFRLSEYIGPNTRSQKSKYVEVKSVKSELRKGPIAYMTDILNSD